jgi:hypothetical protein
MRRTLTFRTVAAATLTTAVAIAGCGGGGDKAQTARKVSVKAGKVLFSDAFDDSANHNGWLTVDRLVKIEKGRYLWSKLPEDGGSSLPDSELKLKLPDGVAASVDVEMTTGSALRGLTCREAGGKDRSAWYELGVDGQRAQIRKMHAGAAPTVLQAVAAPIANGRNVRLTANCVPDANGDLILSLSTDGREVVRTVDDQPVVGEPSTVAVFGYARPDSKGPADMVWDDFEIRAATAS